MTNRSLITSASALGTSFSFPQIRHARRVFVMFKAPLQMKKPNGMAQLIQAYYLTRRPSSSRLHHAHDIDLLTLRCGRRRLINGERARSACWRGRRKVGCVHGILCWYLSLIFACCELIDQPRIVRYWSRNML